MSALSFWSLIFNFFFDYTDGEISLSAAQSWCVLLTTSITLWVGSYDSHSNFATHYNVAPTLLLMVRCCLWPLYVQDSIILLTIREHSSVQPWLPWALPIEDSYKWAKDDGVSLTSALLLLWQMGHLPGSFRTWLTGGFSGLTHTSNSLRTSVNFLNFLFPYLPWHFDLSTLLIIVYHFLHVYKDHLNNVSAPFSEVFVKVWNLLSWNSSPLLIN